MNLKKQIEEAIRNTHINEDISEEIAKVAKEFAAGVLVYSEENPSEGISSEEIVENYDNILETSVEAKEEVVEQKEEVKEEAPKKAGK